MSKVFSNPLDSKAPQRGSYALVLRLPFQRIVLVGKLGLVEFPRGHYIYFGSALGGLKARVGRHLRQQKKRHWHADYLGAEVPWEYAWQLADGQTWECVWASQAVELDEAESPVPGFGSSDCRCKSHLIRVNNVKQVRELFKSLSPASRRLRRMRDTMP